MISHLSYIITWLSDVVPPCIVGESGPHGLELGWLVGRGSYVQFYRLVSQTAIRCTGIVNYTHQSMSPVYKDLTD